MWLYVVHANWVFTPASLQPVGMYLAACLVQVICRTLAIDFGTIVVKSKRATAPAWEVSGRPEL